MQTWMLPSSVTSMQTSDRRPGCSSCSACSCSAASGRRHAATTLRRTRHSGRVCIGMMPQGAAQQSTAALPELREAEDARQYKFGTEAMRRRH